MGMTAGPCYPIDSPPPEGYLQWHQWAQDMYHKHKLRQRQCYDCSLWMFPQELSDVLDVRTVERNGKQLTRVSPICRECVGKRKSAR
jgi:hypothetical protein